MSECSSGNTVWGNTERDSSGKKLCTVRWYPFDSSLILASAEVWNTFLHRHPVEFILRLLLWCCMKLHCQTVTTSNHCTKTKVHKLNQRSSLSLCNTQNPVQITFDSLFIIKTQHLCSMHLCRVNTQQYDKTIQWAMYSWMYKCIIHSSVVPPAGNRAQNFAWTKQVRQQKNIHHLQSWPVNSLTDV